MGSIRKMKLIVKNNKTLIEQNLQLPIFVANNPNRSIQKENIIVINHKQEILKLRHKIYHFIQIH